MDSPAYKLKPGDVIRGKYRLVRQLGAGGMALVYQGVHERLGIRVALKVLREEARLMPDILARFEREARAIAKLQNPYVARITDVDTLPDGSPFLVMEYLEGWDLADELQTRGRFDISEAVDYVYQASLALSEAHELGIVHRDVKPQNLFLVFDGDHCRIKLLDFGISKLLTSEETQLTISHSLLGTPLYMAPEQIRSARLADARSDVWSLGVMLYEFLTGALPFAAKSVPQIIMAVQTKAPTRIRKLRPEVPAELEAVVMRALEKNPDRRFQAADELAEALSPFVSDGFWQSPAPRTKLTSSRPPANRHPSVAPPGGRAWPRRSERPSAPTKPSERPFWRRSDRPSRRSPNTEFRRAQFRATVRFWAPALLTTALVTVATLYFTASDPAEANRVKDTVGEPRSSDAR